MQTDDGWCGLYILHSTLHSLYTSQKHQTSSRTRGEGTGHSNIYDGELKMPDQERRVAKVNIGADFTLLRYCEYLPWLERGRVKYLPLVSELRPDRKCDPGTRGGDSLQ